MFEPKKEKNEAKAILSYVPHGINPKSFYKITALDEINATMELRKRMFGDREAEVNFILLFNSRNIRRKMVPDLIFAFQIFCHSLTEEQRKGVRLILHCAPIDENGTDLPAVIRDCTPDIATNIVFSHARLETVMMNKLYNIADGTVLCSENEGFGISTVESLMAETMIIANVTGGLQDQMGFVDEKGNFLSEDKHFSSKWGSNRDGKYKKHGEWCIPVWPNNFAIQGSTSTPYVGSSRCDYKDIAVKIRELYDLGKEERTRCGKLGREYCLQQPYNSPEMCRRFITSMDYVFEHWKPRDKIGVYKP